MMDATDATFEREIETELNNKLNNYFIDLPTNYEKILTDNNFNNEYKIKIEYKDVDYKLAMDYFYIGSDLILGQNFNNVVFEKSNVDFQNVALK